MSSFDGLQARALLAKGTVIQALADQPIALRTRALASGVDTVTSVTVTTATNIVFVSVKGGNTTTDTYTFATYTTVGALADAINKDGRFEAKVLDALRSDLTTGSGFVTGAITAGTDANGVVVYDVLVDTSVFKAITVALSGARDFNTGKLAQTHRVHLQEVVYFATLGGAATNLFRIYRRRGSVEVQLSGDLSVSATKTTTNWASGQGKITGNEGDELIARLQDGTSLADAAAFIRVAGIIE